MIRPIANINCNYNLVNKNNPSFSGNYKSGINFIVKSEKLPVANKPLTAAMALEKGKDFDSKFVEETLRNV